MTDLKCSATNCLHNCDCYCCKREILVEGSDAEQKKNTCCGSFDLKTTDTTRNSFETPEPSLKVACEATNCVYNKARLCQAAHIDINGPAARHAEATECATFKMR